jgi:hypothetical protein
VVAPRDLYSAFLASCVQGERLDAGRARELWPGVYALFQAALSHVQQPASSRQAPASFGFGRSQSRSPVKAGKNAAKGRDAVPCRGEFGQGCRIARTPCLEARGAVSAPASRESHARFRHSHPFRP